MWSGQIVKATFYPEWIEEYEEAIYKTVTDSKGNTSSVFSHYETRHRTHDEYWTAECTVRGETRISREFWRQIESWFGGSVARDGNKSGFDEGDKNIYECFCEKTGYVIPTTDVRSWENRVKAAPSVFSFPKVPVGVKVFEWPGNNDSWLGGNRLLGGVPIDTLEWDRMNSRLGAKKKVNAIMVYFNGDKQMALWQQAKWVGGKKNDLVICYGGKDRNIAEWSFVFGWTEKEIVKRNIETMLIGRKIDNTVIVDIEKEVVKNYVKKNWHKFDYITVEPSGAAMVWMIVVSVIVQIGWWIFALMNDVDKYSEYRRWR